jgi:hypothetical protein
MLRFVAIPFHGSVLKREEWQASTRNFRKLNEKITSVSLREKSSVQGRAIGYILIELTFTHTFFFRSCTHV